ncbi:hypothetical protein [Nonomuraea sediminis]|uniref:hypothetical protein n=1 Tax=Nonomuraea sediminis TaxID=2835864 RepID=UPI001BDC1EA1|nr:hypothetical protein [Nonomuraea sediminis]
MKRLAAKLGGSVLALGAVSLVGIGAFILSMPGDGGFADLGKAGYQTDGYAITTDPYDWSTGSVFLGALDKVRIRVIPSGGVAFVGLAKPEDLNRYLEGVAYTTGHENTGKGVTFTRHPGHAPATPPGQAGFWTARSEGSGPLTLQFDAKAQQGDRVLVALNADGSPSVGGRVETAATQPSLPWVGAGFIAGGVLLGAGSILTFRRPRR